MYTFRTGALLLTLIFTSAAAAQAPARAGRWDPPRPMKLFPEKGNSLLEWYEEAHIPNFIYPNPLAGPAMATFRMYMESAHVALIPSGPRQGQIIVWSGQGIALAPAGQVPEIGVNATILEDRTRDFWIIDTTNNPPTAQKFGSPFTDTVNFNLFCSGHCWLADGRLFVAGGGGPLESPQGAFVWDPITLNFTKVGSLHWARYYPTTTTLWDGNALVFGGCGSTPNAAAPGGEAFVPFADFEIFDPANFGSPVLQQIFAPASGVETFEFYPRTFVTYDKSIFIAGDTPPSIPEPQIEKSPWDCSPTQFTPQDQHVACYRFDLLNLQHFDRPSNGPSADRYYGNAVIFERDPSLAGPRERIFTLFGSDWARKAALAPYHCNGPYAPPSDGEALSSIDEFRRDPADPAQWIRFNTYFEHGNYIKRLFSNSVILPDGNIFAVGGCSNDPHNIPYNSSGGFNWPAPVYESEIIYINDTGPPVRKTMAPMRVPRVYHSCAILLPDARVLTIGGAARDLAGSAGAPAHPRPDDTIEIFSPPYLFQGVQVRILNISSNIINYGSTLTAEVSSNEILTSQTRAVLVRPGSVSHHFDFDQRHVTLKTETPTAVPGQPNRYIVKFNAPPAGGEGMAPPGWYMLFIISPGGVPSHAEFVELH